MVTFDQAIQSLFRIAVVERKSTSVSRLQVLADYCVQELARRGLENVETEASIPGAGRSKKWDRGLAAWSQIPTWHFVKIYPEESGRNGAEQIDDLMGEQRTSNSNRRKSRLGTSWSSMSKAMHRRHKGSHGTTPYNSGYRPCREGPRPRGRLG